MQMKNETIARSLREEFSIDPMSAATDLLQKEVNEGEMNRRYAMFNQSIERMFQEDETNELSRNYYCCSYKEL